MAVTIALADLADPEFAALVDRHRALCNQTAPAESCHNLEIAALAVPDLTVWQAGLDGRLVGMVALKSLGSLGGEVKSMHTAEEARGQGVAGALLSTVKDTARRRGYPALWLETGVHPFFAAARRLYAASGFVETDPFAGYRLDPHSIFMTCALPAIEGG